jgi:hypothetical protein
VTASNIDWRNAAQGLAFHFPTWGHAEFDRVTGALTSFGYYWSSTTILLENENRKEGIGVCVFQKPDKSDMSGAYTRVASQCYIS